MDEKGRNLTNARGSYVVLLCLQTPTQVTVGKLGQFSFPAGTYAYAGSALGPGGLVARIKRHLRHPKPLHWHIDYLRAHARPYAVWLIEGKVSRECALADRLTRSPGAQQPAPGFGSSDCRCQSHLIHFPTPPTRETVEGLARAIEVRFDE